MVKFVDTFKHQSNLSEIIASDERQQHLIEINLSENLRADVILIYFTQ